jgi:hypothetical protein
MHTKFRSVVLGIALAMSGCGDDDGGFDAGRMDAGGDDDGGGAGDDGGADDDGGGADEDAGADTDGGGDDAGGSEIDAGMLTPSVAASDQTLELSTVVVIAEVVAADAGWLVVHEDSGGPGAMIGITEVPAGTSTNVEVALDRPAEASETLHAMLHIDAGTIGTFDETDDVPVMVADATVTDAFVVTTPDGTPAVRLTASASGTSAWAFTVEPARYADTVGPEADPVLTFLRGWRYEIAYTPAGHHFQLIRAGATASLDSVLLNQGGDGSLESNAGIDWDETDGTAVRFTVNTSFEAAVVGVNGYRCGIHTSTMRGDVGYATP